MTTTTARLSKALFVRLEEDTHYALRLYALQHDTTASDLVRAAIVRVLAASAPPTPGEPEEEAAQT